MARLAAPSSSSRANTVDSLYRTPSVPPPQRDQSVNQVSPGSSSDKENQQSRLAAIKAGKMPMSADDDARGPKRRRLGDRDGSVQYESSSSDHTDDESTAARPIDHSVPHAAASNGPRYDPHQPVEERREVRKKLRALDKEMQDSRNEWLNPESRELQEHIKKQDQLYQNVKQTSDATIDSRILVNAGDIAHKRAKQLNVGESAQGIDLEEFVGKCISFMGHDTAEEPEDDTVDDQGNALDWAFLGANACFPSNVRPPTIGFLLGPLAVQKRARQPTQRKARAKNASANVETTKAREVKSADLQSQESNSLVRLCHSVKEEFLGVLEDAKEALDDFWTKKDAGQINDEQLQEFAEWNPLMDDGGLNFLKFALHPTDFGQSAENLFYISFLIRDDHLKIVIDEETGMLSLHAIENTVREDSNRVKDTRHQAVFALDFETWEGLVKEFHVTQCLIPNRESQDEATQQPNANGWYG